MPRLFTTPTPQATILTGKLLSVFMTVCAQVVVLLIAGHLIFGIQWGPLLSVALTAAGVIFSASSFGIFVNSFLKNTKQAGVLFGRCTDRDRHAWHDQHLCREFVRCGAWRYGLTARASGLGDPRTHAVHERRASQQLCWSRRSSCSCGARPSSSSAC